MNLLFIALGAYFVAGAANAVLARSIRVVPTADDAPLGERSLTSFGPTHVDFQSIAERNLIGAKRENLTPVAAGMEVEPSLVSGRDYDPNNLRPCSISATLRATLVAEGAPEWSMAVLNVKDEAQVFSIADGRNKIQDDAYLVDVLERAIVVRRRDHFERCSADNEQTTVATSPVVSDLPAHASSDEDTGGVQKTSETQYTIARAEVDRALGNLNEVATQARIVPSFKNGKANGFKLFSIKPGSIYSKIGMQNGDVIQKINGYEMNSPDKALEIYQKLKDAASVQIELQRRGQPMTFNYNIGG